jgi:thiamine kinase-like enzyme
MPRSVPEELASRWVPGRGPVTLKPLAAGLVNESYRVERDGRVYSMRLAADALELGVDREWECRVIRCAARAGLAPVIVCCEPAQGILVAEWTGGHAWTAEELRLPGNVRALTGLLRRVHALPIPRPARIMSPAAWIAHYGGAASRRAAARTGTRPVASTGLHGAAKVRLEELAGIPSAHSVLCHSDLHRLNLAAGERFVLLDWEYAHVSDPCWDLAAWIANNDGTASFAAHVLAGYLERPPGEHELERLRLLTWLYDYVCLLWSELYLAQRAGDPGGEVSARASTLALRLNGASGGRETQVPAH